jgi:tripartite-type tricarboxylate transporter receptor subunit TctC
MKELSPGSLKRLCAVLVLVAGSLSGARAETYPDRPVKLLSIHPVGITSDLLARALGQKLGDELGQSIVVENRPGANGILATNVVAKSQPDGYTMLITSGSHVANALLNETLPYDTLKDFAPITALSASYGLVLITNLPVKSLAELIDIGKKRPLSYATNGAGNTTHIAGMLLEKAAGIEMNAVPYSTNSMITDVISGNVDLMFVGTVNADPLVRAGQVRAIATTGSIRSKLMPELPTFQELGYKDFDVSGYFGLLFPAGTPKDRVEKMQSAVAKVLMTPEMQSFLKISDYYAVGSKPEEFRAFLEADYQQQAKLLKELGLSKR